MTTPKNHTDSTLSSDSSTPVLPIAPRLILALAFISALPALAIDAYLPGFVGIAADLGASASAVQLTLTAFMIGLAAGQLVIGPLSDQIGRRTPLIVGTVLTTLASFACAIAPTVEILATARLVQGLAGAAGVVLARAIIADRADGSLAARLFGVMMVIQGVAPVVAPLLGGFLVSWIGWRSVFVALGLFTLVMLVVTCVMVPETLPVSKRRSGGLSDMISSCGTVIRNRKYLGYSLAVTSGLAAMFAYISASPFVFQGMLGLSPGQFSWFFAVNAVGLTVMSAVAAKLAVRVQPRRLMIVGLAIMATSATALLVIVATGWLHFYSLAVPLFVTVSALGLVMGNGTALAIEQVPLAAGAGSAVIGCAEFVLGAAVAPIVGLGGEGTALPMAVTITVACLVALFGVFIARSTTRKRMGTRSNRHRTARVTKGTANPVTAVS